MNPTSAEPTEQSPAIASGRVAADVAAALSEVHARRGILVRLAYRFLWNVDDAEDAVQSALLQAARKQEQLADCGKVWSWVRAIVVRQCHDTQRAKLRRQRTAEAARERAATDTGSDERVERADDSAHVRAAIEALPERQRTAIVLRHLEELSYAEMAAIMQTTESTARVQVRNGREALRRALTRRDGASSAGG